MANIKRIFPILLVAGALFIVPGCASEQAEHTTTEVTNDTGSAVGSVLDATGHVIMYPFHLVGDLFS
jgi:hypothetical protein